MARDKSKKTARKAARKKRFNAVKVKRMIVRIAVGLLLALPIPFVNTAIGYMPLMAYLFTCVLSAAYVRFLKSRLVFEQNRIGEGCLRGEKLAFKLGVQNPTLLPAVSIDVSFFISDLFGGERERAHQCISLPPRSSKTFDFAVCFDHVGEYQVGIDSIELGDPFGLFKSARETGSLQDVFVQPRVYDIADIELSTEAAQESKRTVVTVINDGMDYCGVREYRWGDPIKSVHWKLSASTPTGEYFTRLYETTCNPGIEVLIDFDSLQYPPAALMDAYDALVESALSVESWGSRQGFETNLLFADAAGQTYACKGPLADQRSQLMRLMPRISVGDGRRMLDILRTQASSVYAQNNVFVCSACITDELIGALMSVQSQRKTPILIAVVPHEASDDQRSALSRRLARLSAARIAYRTIETADELERGN